MSEPGYEVDLGNRAGGDAGDDDHGNHQYDIQQDSGPHERNSAADINKTMRKKTKKMMMIQFQGRGYGGAGDLVVAKRVALFPFARTKKYLSPSNNTKSRKRPPSSNSSSSSSASAAAVPKTTTVSCFPRAAGNYKAKAGIGSCFCLKQSRISESPVGSHSSDPNDPSFTLDKLKALIEKNDFYAEDCNPHFFDSNQW